MKYKILVFFLCVYCANTYQIKDGQTQHYKEDMSAKKENMCPLLPNMEVDMCDSSDENEEDNSFLKKDGDLVFSVPEGTMCLADSDIGIQNALTCLDGDWKLEVNHGKYTTGQHLNVREKRFILTLITVIVGVSVIAGAIICLILCPHGAPANKPPKIKCPEINSPIYTDKGKTTAIVSWPPATATDPEEGDIGVRTLGDVMSGREHEAGRHNVSYEAKDKAGLTDTCTSYYDVIVRTCDYEYTYLSSGSVNCQPEGKMNIYGSQCEYSCDEGYQLNGSATVECQVDKLWTHPKPSCEAISCGPPGDIDRGTFTCSSDKYIYKSKCTVSCDEGFDIEQDDIIRCQANKEWTTAGQCKDTEAPDITCGGDIEVFAGPQLAAVNVTWPQPQAEDNSGISVSVSSNPSSGSLFEPGQTKVTFTATDHANNIGQCSIIVFVKVKRCDNFQRPNNSDVSCSHSNAYGSKCEVTCHQAYEIVGESTHTCQENQTWSGGQAHCTERSCTAPPSVTNGHYDCANGQKYQESCHLICDDGFKPTAPLTITCNINIRWSQTGSCRDVQVPVFPAGCPTDMIVTAASLGQPTYVAYTFPDVTDNSNETITVIGDPVSGSDFSIGTTVVTITAIDYTGNNDSCQFSVTVRYSSCSKPNLDNTGKDLLEYDCPNDYVYGATCQMSCADGNPLNGANLIKCDKDDETSDLAWTWSGNVPPFCDPKQCKKLDAPLNGALACDSLGNGVGEFCQLLCNENYTYPASASDTYTCFTSRGEWAGSFVPGCIRRRRPGQAKTKPDFYYFSNECNENQTEIKEKFLERIDNSVFGNLCTPPAECSVDTVRVTCGPVSGRRRKRAADQVDTGNLASGPASEKREKRMADQYEYQISLEITFGPVYDKETSEATLNFYEKLSFQVNEHLNTEANAGLFDIPEIGTFYEFDFGTSEFSCPPGTKFISATASCTGCGEGYTYDNTTASCTKCLRGSYQDQEISYSCVQCPGNKTTKGNRSVSADQCLDLCLPGQFSSSGIQPCKVCPIGQYQSKYGSTECDLCSFGMSTKAVGSSLENDCQSIVVSCFQMTESLLTQDEITQYSSSCGLRQNSNILVVDEVDDTLIPSTCDDNNNCRGQPCGQHGTCIDWGSFHSCLCDDLWSGDACQIEPDFCTGHECDNGALCVSQPEQGGYSCTCAEGFKGKLCSQPVVNGAWGTWNEWSVCSVSCGLGTVSRTRECDNPVPDPEGENCHGDSEETKDCDEGPCPVPCRWSQWTAWVCDSTCGAGTATRTRYREQKAAHGGQNCRGAIRNSRDCDMPACPVIGVYGDWSVWSECSASCGGGVSFRNRACYSNQIQGHCEGSAIEDKACNEQVCPVCQDLELVQGQKEWNCTRDEKTDMQTCQIICEQGLTVISPVETSFQCGHMTGYSWSQQTRDNPTGILPSCSDQKLPLQITPEISYNYDIDCNNPPPANEVKSTIESQMNSVNCIQDGTCNSTTEIKLSCNRRKRSADSMKAALVMEMTAFSGIEPKYRSQMTEEEAEAEIKKLQSVDEMIRQIANASDDIFIVSINGVEFKGHIEKIQARIICQDGSGLQAGMCVDCPPGSYSARNGSCILCDRGFYQELARMSSCEPCPVCKMNGKQRTTTSGKGSNNLAQCLIDPPSYEDLFPSYVRWYEDNLDDDDEDDTKDEKLDGSSDKDSGNGRTLRIALGVTFGFIAVIITAGLIFFIWSKNKSRRIGSSFLDMNLLRSNTPAPPITHYREASFEMDDNDREIL